MGATPMTSMREEKTLADCWSSKRSRTMARAMTISAQPPRAWTEAKGGEGGDVPGEGAAGGGEGEEDEADVERGFAAEAVGERAVDQLADGEAEEVGGEGPLDVGDAGR